MFIGREKELALLQEDYIGKAIMVYGKRRVGKTTLIRKALESCQYQKVYFECLKSIMQDNIYSTFSLFSSSDTASSVLSVLSSVVSSVSLFLLNRLPTRTRRPLLML